MHFLCIFVAILHAQVIVAAYFSKLAMFCVQKEQKKEKKHF